MTCLIIGAWTLYVVIIIVLFRNFLISIKLKNKGVNIIQYFPQKQKKLVVFLMLGAYILLFLYTFLSEFKLGKSFLDGIISGLLNCFLVTFKPTNFILIGVFLLMLFIDKKAKGLQSTVGEKNDDDEIESQYTRVI